MGPPLKEINLISCGPMAHVSDIKLIRTDTTLDLSQKAEKGMLCSATRFRFYMACKLPCFMMLAIWDEKTQDMMHSLFPTTNILFSINFTSL
ncbi:hypothetical protein PRUPE_1G384300 [Prunus persica]|uniref:Uncharacterized protein n=1 Tax=Prunus persica TaxID=3760 RepID=A0A251R9R9_PRUPE|nr:hypothetical protein PRUPE_1G384300 [Prunus persica]